MENKWIKLTDVHRDEWIIRLDNISAIGYGCIVINGNHGEDNGLLQFPQEQMAKLKKALMLTVDEDER